MVKADWRQPFLAVLKVFAPALLISLVNWVLKGAPFAPGNVGCLSFILWGLLVGNIKGVVRTVRGEKRRRAAASGKQWFPLASPQPYPDPEALPLPFVISLRPGRLAFLLTPIITWIGVVGALYLGFWPYVWPNEGPVIHTLALTLALMLASSAVILFSMYRWVEVDEEGLKVRNLLWSKRVLWREARLFAADASLKAEDDLKRYELSSATTILRWPWNRNSSSWTQPSCSFAEYEWQMRALHCVIAARTGLPLYDLRDGVASGSQAVPYPLPPPSIPAQP
jgi:hypothetical protein